MLQNSYFIFFFPQEVGKSEDGLSKKFSWRLLILVAFSTFVTEVKENFRDYSREYKPLPPTLAQAGKNNYPPYLFGAPPPKKPSRCENCLCYPCNAVKTYCSGIADART
eukprot:UN31499